MHPLGRLIAQRMDHPDHRWSVRDVERRARDQGETLNKTTVSDLRKGMTPTITRANVYGLAAGLGVTPLAIALAALESWGIETRPVEVTDTLATVAIDPTLSDRDRRQLRALITDMRENNTAEGSDDDQDTSPARSSSSPAGAPSEAPQDEKTRYFNVFRYDPAKPDVVVQTVAVSGRTMSEARDKLRRGLERGGPTILDSSDRSTIITVQGEVTQLFGLVPDDRPDLEDGVIAKLRERASHLAELAGESDLERDVAVAFKKYMNPAGGPSGETSTASDRLSLDVGYPLKSDLTVDAVARTTRREAADLVQELRGERFNKDIVDSHEAALTDLLDKFKGLPTGPTPERVVDAAMAEMFLAIERYAVATKLLIAEFQKVDLYATSAQIDVAIEAFDFYAHVAQTFSPFLATLVETLPNEILRAPVRRSHETLVELARWLEGARSRWIDAGLSAVHTPASVRQLTAARHAPADSPDDSQSPDVAFGAWVAGNDPSNVEQRQDGSQ